MNDWIIEQIRRREREPEPLQLPVYDEPPPGYEEEAEESPEPRGVVIIDLMQALRDSIERK